MTITSLSLLLYITDLDQIDELFAEYDQTLAPNVSSDNPFALLDASSLLWRLNVSTTPPPNISTVIIIIVVYIVSMHY